MYNKFINEIKERRIKMKILAFTGAGISKQSNIPTLVDM